jgi:hypothetical protein
MNQIARVKNVDVIPSRPWPGATLCRMTGAVCDPDLKLHDPKPFLMRTSISGHQSHSKRVIRFEYTANFL